MNIKHQIDQLIRYSLKYFSLVRIIVKLTVITSSGNKYSAAKLIESNSFELNRPRCIMQISSDIPFWCILVIVRLKINFGIEYNADVIQTPSITSCIDQYPFQLMLKYYCRNEREWKKNKTQTSVELVCNWFTQTWKHIWKMM